MPCNTIRTVSVDLAAACQNMDLLAKAIEALGGTVRTRDGQITADLDGDRITIRNGQVTGRNVTPEQVKKIQTAYGMQAAKKAAHQMGFGFKMTSPTTFKFTKATL